MQAPNSSPSTRLQRVFRDQGFQRLAMLIGIVLVLVLIEGSSSGLSCRPDYPSGVELPNDPIQLETDAAPWQRDGYQFEPKAMYDIEAMVVRTKRYVRGPESDLAPFDVGVVWGPMTNEELLETTRWKQNTRFMFWRPEDERVLLFDRYIANMHLIPADRQIRRQIARLRPGDVIHMTGYLVRVTGDNGFIWNSSMSRDDDGNGACEVMWVDTLEVR